MTPEKEELVAALQECLDNSAYRGLYVGVRRSTVHTVIDALAAMPDVPVKTRRGNIETMIDEYIDGYVMEGDSGCHTPTEPEQALIKDAIVGLLADSDFIAALTDAPEPSTNMTWVPRHPNWPFPEPPALPDAPEPLTDERVAQLIEYVACRGESYVELVRVVEAEVRRQFGVKT